MSSFVIANEYCELVTDGTHDSPKKTESGVKLVTSRNIIGGKLDLSSAYFISSNDAENINKRSRVDVNDILISMIGTVGESCFVSKNPDFVIKNVGLFKFNSNDFYKSKWLFFYLQSDMAKNAIKDRLRGTTQQYIPLGELRKFPVLLPKDEKHRKFVVDYLSDLDDKSQLNTQTNQTLEQIAQAIFKSWFVDFDPVKAKIDALANGGTHADAECAAMQIISGKTDAELTQMQQTNPDAYKTLEKTAALFPSEMVESELGEVPKGWDRDIASNLFDISIGKTPPRKESEWFSTNNKDIPWLSIRDMGGNEIFSSLTSEYLTKEATDKFNIKIAPKNTVFLSFKLTVGRVSIASTEMCTNEAIAHFLQQEHSLSYFWLYCYLKSFNFESLGSTSSIATAVNSKTIKNLPIIYHDLLVREFHKKVTPIFNKILGLEQEIENLVKIRDALLPKLLSGNLG